LTDVAVRFGSLVNKPWPEPVENALMLPITRAGQERPYGMLVAGVSPRRVLDDDYRGFFALVASHVATAVGNARAYEEERERATALAELDRAKTAFFSNVSHEFRTPLTLLLGPLEECLSRTDVTSSMRESLGVSHRNALRLLRLVNSLLEFSRIEAGRVQAVYEATDLAGYTAELASSFRSAVERAGIAFVVDCPKLTEPVFIDRDMWEKIVLNLLSNAFKFTFAGQITVSLRGRDEYAELVVRDTGTGIPAAEIPKVFERFHRVANVRSRTYEGTGIGLALVKELVKCHGGQIEAESTEGAGSAFVVRIPFGSAHLPADRVRGASMSSWAAASRLGIASYIEEAQSWSLPSEAEWESSVPAVDEGREQLSEQARVLLADDNADMREYVARLLRAQGWTVHTVSDGRAALDAVIATKPDLVLSDVMMPSLDGFGLLRELRAREDTKSIPVLLLSARAGVEARVDGAHAGADDYIVKPFVAQELVARVGSHLALARERARAVAAFERALDELQRIFQQSPSIIAVLRGTDHRFALANDAYLQLVRRTADDILGKPLLEALPELRGQGFDGLLDGVLATGVPYVGREVAVTLRRAPNDEPGEVIVNFVYVPIVEPDGSRSGVIVHANDVTAQVRARREIELAREQADAARVEAENANRAKSDFLAAMSHELRTPLNAIAGYVDLLRMGIHGTVTEAQHAALERIERSERHLLSLINDILNFAKVEAGRVEYDLADVPLSDVVADIAPFVQLQLAKKQLTYEANVDTDIVVRADREKVRQILLNLLSNAIKFTNSGGRIAIEAVARAAGEQPKDVAFLRVTDSGIGIPAEKETTIFDPFVQVHRNLTRSMEGTGLGLAISRDLARGMGGDLRVRSVEGRGSSFTLTLPLRGGA
jgi:signal transduction histidine kinase